MMIKLIPNPPTLTLREICCDLNLSTIVKKYMQHDLKKCDYWYPGIC